MRVGQIRRQVLAHRAVTFEAMSDLPKQLRADLAASFSVLSTRVEKHLFARDDTHKLVLRLADDRMIECVLIQDDGRPPPASARRSAAAWAASSAPAG